MGVRWIDFVEAERLTKTLAERLDAWKTQQGYRDQDIGWVGIPRGGLIVLGILSYWLKLPSQQVGCTPLADGPIVVVDDCALSGARFASWLRTQDARPVIFAHLLSPEILRQRIAETESEVVAVIAADNLEPLSRPDPDWQRVWRERLPGTPYWLGALPAIAFPWNEPDQVLWNAKENRLEDHWHRASPRRVLAHQQELSLPWVEDPGPVDLSGRVVWKKEEGEIILWHEPTDQTYGLDGTAAEMWKALVAFGDVERAANHLIEQYDVEHAELTTDLREFLDDLIEKGVLTHRDSR